MENTNQQKNLFESIRENWQIVLVIVSIIFSWAYFQFNLAALNVRVGQVEQKAAVIDSVSGDIKGINAKLDIILKKVQL